MVVKTIEIILSFLGGLEVDGLHERLENTRLMRGKFEA
jgi:hypothetical protein